jgi:hypothetical protein
MGVTRFCYKGHKVLLWGSRGFVIRVTKFCYGGYEVFFIKVTKFCYGGYKVFLWGLRGFVMRVTKFSYGGLRSFLMRVTEFSYGGYEVLLGATKFCYRLLFHNKKVHLSQSPCIRSLSTNLGCSWSSL